MMRKISDDMARMSVLYNDLYIPGRSIEDYFSKYCEPLGVLVDWSDFPLFVRGSATLIKYRGRYFVACTRHQVKDISAREDVCLMLPHDGRLNCITSGGAISYDKSKNAGDHHDVVLFDFTDPVMDMPELEHMFLDFRGQNPDVPSDHVVAVVTYGYPSGKTKLDYDDRKLRMLKEKVVCRYAGQGHDDALHTIAPIVPMNFKSDGMSGGPAFTIIREGEGLTIHLAGIIARAGREQMRIIKAGALQMMMEERMRLRPRPAIDL